VPGIRACQPGGRTLKCRPLAVRDPPAIPVYTFLVPAIALFYHYFMDSHCPPAERKKLAFPTFRRLTKNEICIAVALWALLTLFSISCSYARGKLSIPLTWDDVDYFLDAYPRLQAFYDKGIGAVVRGYITATPHAPLSTGLAFFGFLLFGVRDLGPYILNSCIVLVLIVYALKFFNPVNSFLRWLAPVYVCMVPLAGMGIIEFRPDFAASLFVALGIVTNISQPFVRSSRSHLMAGGTLFGLAILSKPTFLPFTVFIWGCSVAAALLCDFFEDSPRRSLRGAVRSIAIEGAIMVALGLVYLACGWHDLLNYIRAVMFSEQTKIWTATTQGTFAYAALYFLKGVGGKQMLGGHLWILAAWIVIGFLFLPWAARGWRLRWISLMALILISYIFVSANIAKAPGFGLPFQILMVFAALASVQAVLDWFASGNLPSCLQYVLAASLLLPGLYFLQPWYPVRGIPGDPYTVFLWEAHNRILDVTAKQRIPPPVKVYLTAVGDLNPASLHWMAIKRGLTAEFPACDALSDNIASQQKLIENADEIIVPEQETPGTYEFLPSAKISSQLLDILRHDSRYILADQIPALTGKSVFVWLNQPFQGWMPGLGFNPTERPRANSPRVQWAMAPEARMILHGIRTGSATISGSGLSFLKDQEMKIHVGDNVIGIVEIPESGKFVDFSFSTTIEDPSQPIVLTFSTWDRSNPALPRAVLFQRLDVVNQSQKSDARGKE
jgi:hypothetical protein